MSDKKGESRRIRMKLLAEAWAREAEEELKFGADDVEPMMQAMRDAFGRQLAHRSAGGRA